MENIPHLVMDRKNGYGLWIEEVASGIRVSESEQDL